MRVLNRRALRPPDWARLLGSDLCLGEPAMIEQRWLFDEASTAWCSAEAWRARQVLQVYWAGATPPAVPRDMSWSAFCNCLRLGLGSAVESYHGWVAAMDPDYTHYEDVEPLVTRLAQCNSVLLMEDEGTGLRATPLRAIEQLPRRRSGQLRWLVPVQLLVQGRDHARLGAWYTPLPADRLESITDEFNNR